MIGFLRKAASSLWSPEWYQRNGYYRIAQMLGAGQATSSGEAITVEKAMRCSAAFICTRVVTESMASMPLPILRKEDDKRIEERETDAWRMLNGSPNSYQSAKLFRRTLGHHALNYGNGFAKVDRRGRGPNAEAYALHIIHPSNFVEKVISGGQARFKFNINGKTEEYGDRDILHLMGHSEDGLTGIGAVELGREAIGQALAIEGYGATFFGRGGMRAGVLTKTKPFHTDEDRKRFERDLREKYRNGKESFHSNLIVEGEWDYKPVGSDPTEAQLVEARTSMVPEIARFYGLTPHLAGDLSRAHFNNVEHLWIEFINITLMPWMTAWEQEISRVLLTDKQQKDGLYAKHNAAAFMRGDFEARMRAYSIQLQNGLISINEGRAFEDLDPVEGGDAHHIQLNMQTVPGSGEPTASEKAAMAKTQGAAQ